MSLRKVNAKSLCEPLDCAIHEHLSNNNSIDTHTHLDIIVSRA